ncbi:hypothetical protein J6590_045894 [Homalodisca vitripennis]|nr:hypothetical protein J6590_045894 [Homalodisca vitripennis]
MTYFDHRSKHPVTSVSGTKPARCVSRIRRVLGERTRRLWCADKKMRPFYFDLDILCWDVNQGLATGTGADSSTAQSRLLHIAALGATDRPATPRRAASTRNVPVVDFGGSLHGREKFSTNKSKVNESSDVKGLYFVP